MAKSYYNITGNQDFTMALLSEFEAFNTTEEYDVLAARWFDDKGLGYHPAGSNKATTPSGSWGFFPAGQRRYTPPSGYISRRAPLTIMALPKQALNIS
jgi:hypothetical protein